MTAWSRAWYARAVKLMAILRHKPYRRALRFGVAASTEHAHTSLPHDYATVLDIGANRGQFALLATRRFPGACMICIEPLEGPRATLERVLPDRTRVRVIGTALAAASRESHMFVSRADDSSSLLAPTEQQLSRFPGTDIVDQVSIRTERLDALISHRDVIRPALLKIDVQGSELEVLVGAGGLLDKIDTILVECSFVELYLGQPLADEVVRFLHTRSFALTSVAAPNLDASGQVVQADLVFVRAEAEP
jgi:FkbM family methyltransferase